MADAACIAANVARLRLDRGLTQDQLVARAGISRTALGKIERGTVVPQPLRGASVELQAGSSMVLNRHHTPPARGMGHGRGLHRGGAARIDAGDGGGQDDHRSRGRGGVKIAPRPRRLDSRVSRSFGCVPH